MTRRLDGAVLAVDGGGTRCRFALDTDDGRVAVTCGGANVTTDFDRAIATLTEGLSALALEAGIDAAALVEVPAYLGLAGVLDADDAGRVRAALPLTNATIADDRRAAVRGALGLRDGMLAGLGTGSFFARQSAGEIRLAGGWGARLGDTASGFWIGREALSATLDVEDGLVPATDLTDTLRARFGGAPRGIVAFATRAAPDAYADLAPLVIEAAGAGDTVGAAILDRGAVHVAATLQAIGWKAGLPICLTGGVAGAYADRLPQGMEAARVLPKGTALDGAVSLARTATSEAAR